MFNFKYEKCAVFKYEKCSIFKYEKCATFKCEKCSYHWNVGIVGKPRLSGTLKYFGKKN